MQPLTVFILLLLIRLLSVFVVRTFFVPDEYWQSLEVAHKITFGYGHLTWEWLQGIRSYVYPLAIAIIFKLLALVNLDSVQLLITLPQVLQAILSAYADYRFYIWTGKRKWALFLMAVSWFSFYTGSRTLINTLEASLTTIGLSYYPWHGENVGYLWPVAFCCFIRPTAAVIWLPLFAYQLYKTKLNAVPLLLKRVLPIALTVAVFCIGLDSYLYGRFIVTPYEFLKFNVLNDISSLYGVHPWHWYFSSGLPVVLGINFIFFLYGIVTTVRQRQYSYSICKQLLITLAVSLTVLSFIKHKELRFLLPFLPICLYISADALSHWSSRTSSIYIWSTSLIILFGNVLPAWYLSALHQSGPIELMSHLQTIANDYRDENNNTASIYFLTPCHATPYYSYIHQNVSMRFLTCEPDFKLNAYFKEEQHEFFEAPMHWLNSHIPSHPYTAKPSHLVLFESTNEAIRDFLVDYKLLQTINNPNVASVDTQQVLAALKQDSKELSVDQLNQQLQQLLRGKLILLYQRLRTSEKNIFNAQDESVRKTPTTRKQTQPQEVDEIDF